MCVEYEHQEDCDDWTLLVPVDSPVDSDVAAHGTWDLALEVQSGGLLSLPVMPLVLMMMSMMMPGQ